MLFAYENGVRNNCLDSVILNLVINVKKTTVYTHVNGDRPSHIEKQQK